jgi:AcrR family transcriptional regulator
MAEQAIAVGMRNRILAEATRRFVIHGYNGISMREIAQACGITKAALYYHFRDKEDLILAILDRYLDEMDNLIQRCRSQGGSPRLQLTRVVQAIFTQLPEQRSLIRLASQEMPNLSIDARKRFSAVYAEKFIGQFEAILAEGIEKGEFRPVNVLLAVWTLLGMMYAFFSPSPEREGQNMDQAVALILSIYFEGIT